MTKYLNPSRNKESNSTSIGVTTTKLSPHKFFMKFFKPGACGQRPRAWFLEIVLVHASVCVCMSAPEAINNQWHDMV